jgi:excisionase family DNA binding protein
LLIGWGGSPGELPVTSAGGGRVDGPRVRGRSSATAAPGADTRRRVAQGRRLVGLAVAAEYADVSTRTLRRYISHGRLTGYRVGPRLIKVDLNELDAMARPIPTARGPG